MRYFQAPSALFNALRLQVMQQLGQPNAAAEQPWPEGITYLALGPHEYEPHQELVTYALANGATEITAEQYQALQPKPEFPTP